MNVQHMLGLLLLVVFEAHTVSSGRDADSDQAEDVDSVSLFETNSIELPKQQISAEEKGTLKGTITSLARQVMLQQMFVEEKIRSDGASGIKQVRLNTDGTKPYHWPSHSGRSVCSIHNHDNNKRTLGMGEFVAVLNGIEFRTRHNDYRLNMPSNTSKDYHAVEPIPFPEVPQKVLEKKTVNEQVEEMREWFKAFKMQDYSTRDYRKHFKPVICYLEGAWIKSSDTLEESFESDRHFIDAASWFDLQEKIDYTSYTGRKSQLENYAYLPTRLFGVSNDSIPVPELGQWNYRILCHPLKGDIPLDRFRVVDDLQVRMGNKQTLDDYTNSRAARFRLDPFDKGNSDYEGHIKSGLLDSVMYEIPGKDNYPGEIVDDLYDEEASLLLKGRSGPLNAARYHRWFKMEKKGAMGLQVRKRGFSDPNLFVALNTQPKIVGKTLKECRKTGKGKRARKTVCKSWKQRVSYAIPLEIIYLTPLSNWNPYKLDFKGKPNSPNGRTANAGGRNGGSTVEKAYNGTNEKLYYRIPTEFFSGKSLKNGDAADTSKGSVSVLDKNGKIHKVKSAGHHIIMPNIPGVGYVRQRYPIMPVHGEGSAVWKELEALKDILLEPSRYSHMLREKPKTDTSTTGNGKSGNKDTDGNNEEEGKAPKGFNNGHFQTSPAKQDNHQHPVHINLNEYKKLVDGEKVTILTEQANSHSHELVIELSTSKKGGKYLKYVMCDKSNKLCGDGHRRLIMRVNSGNGNSKTKIKTTDSQNSGSTDTSIPEGYANGSFQTTLSTDKSHRHKIRIPLADYKKLVNGKTVTLTTEVESGHTHTLVIQKAKNKNGTKSWLRYIKCDGNDMCGDGHKRVIMKAANNP